MRRWWRIVKHNVLIALGKADTIYNDPQPPSSLPSEWITDKIMDRDVMIFNMGYKQKYKGYVVVVTPVKFIKRYN